MPFGDPVFILSRATAHSPAVVDRVMSASATSSHGRGSRVDYLPRVQGPFAEWSDLTETAPLTPDELLEVRRPVSYQGMPNYIGRMSLP